MNTSTQSSEDYLETILILRKEKGPVRSIDIVAQTGYKKSSISVAMKKLREKEYITMDEDGYITLTEKGSNLANSIYDKHCALKNIFISIGVNEETAIEDACKIEHSISDETYLCLKKHFNL